VQSKGNAYPTIGGIKKIEFFNTMSIYTNPVYIILLEQMMKKVIPFLFAITLFHSNAFSQTLGQIMVDIKGIKEKPKGVLICFIFNSREDFLKEPKSLQTLNAKIIPGGASCEFFVPMNKEYAVAILDDVNGNRILDKNAFGVPKEGWATSNNITHTFSAPNFDESKVLLKESPLTLTLEMHY